MNRSFSKIKHIQESNQRLERRFINEQSKPNSVYQVNQVLKAKRDIDGQTYTIKIKQIIPNGYDVAAGITGPGDYDGTKLDGTGGWELNAREPGKLSGNSYMGTFTIIK